jgi:iron complex transport system substrate-binding protein
MGIIRIKASVTLRAVVALSMLACLFGMGQAMSWAGPVYPASLTDSEGQTIRIDHPFRRIVSLYPAHTENIILLGAGRALVGIGRGALHLPEGPDRNSQQALIEAVSRVSYRDDPERILALEPDLVLIRPMISRAHPGLVNRLKSQGITVVSLQPSKASELYRYWLDLGLLTGRLQEARDMIGRFDSGLSEMEALVSAIPVQDRPRVYFEAIHAKMKTFAPGSIAIFVLEKAGGRNIAADAFQVRSTNIAYYGKERILAKADQIDVYLAQKGRMNRIRLEDIVNEPGFRIIKAVKEKRVYLVDEALVSRPTPMLMEGIRVIHNLLYGHGPRAIDDQARGKEEGP